VGGRQFDRGVKEQALCKPAWFWPQPILILTLCVTGCARLHGQALFSDLYSLYWATDDSFIVKQPTLLLLFFPGIRAYWHRKIKWS